jgi:hypothetical protein
MVLNFEAIFFGCYRDIFDIAFQFESCKLTTTKQTFEADISNRALLAIR